jgi:alkanesulfonate monooxygenase SsuD/methylene tetrahydromethanopterin reductase-like flavin-dependent oxidoreductase (luciferase family)
VTGTYPRAGQPADSGGTRIKVGILLWSQSTDWLHFEAAAQRADQLGYDSVWLWDHLYSIVGSPTQPIFEGWLSLAAWAATTTQARLGLLVGANTLRNPGLLAKMTTTLDHISGGRAILGLGAAWNEEEHYAHGIPFGAGFGERIGWLDESLRIVRALLAGEVVDHESEQYQFRGAQQFPRPVQARIPILVGGSGERKMLRVVARHADLWNTMGSTELVAHKDQVLRTHCLAIGRDPDEIERTLECKMLIRDDPLVAEREWRRVIEANLSTPDQIRNAWVGSPEMLAHRMREYAAVGFRHFIVELPAPFDEETLDRLIGEVLPMARQ